MRKEDITDDVVAKVAEGIREFNRTSPPSIVRVIHGVVQPPNKAEREEADQNWLRAIRHGLYKACE